MNKREIIIWTILAFLFLACVVIVVDFTAPGVRYEDFTK